jgi:hypothetical protein
LLLQRNKLLTRKASEPPCKKLQFSSFLAATTPSDVKIVFHVGTTLSQQHDTRQAYKIPSTLYTREYLYHSNSTQMVISLIPGLHGQESDGISRNSYCYCWSEIFEFLVIYLFIYSARRCWNGKHSTVFIRFRETNKP